MTSPLDNQIAILRAEIALHEAEANRTHPMAETFHALRNLATAKRAELQRLERTRPVVCDLTKNDEITRIAALEAQLAAPVGVEEVAIQMRDYLRERGWHIRQTKGIEELAEALSAVAPLIARTAVAADRQDMALHFERQAERCTRESEDFYQGYGEGCRHCAAAIRGGEGG